MNNNEVAKRFAEGKTTGKGSNMFINGDTIYSYGYHFPIAKRVKEPDVDYLYETSGYSSSTAKHKSYVHGYLATKRVLEVKGCTLSNAKLQKENNIWQIQELYGKLERARSVNSKYVYKRDIKYLEAQNKLLERYIPQIE